MTEAYRSIVVAVDLSGADHLAPGGPLGPASRAARDRGMALAKSFKGKLHFLTALDLDPFAEQIVTKEAAGGGDSIHERARKFLDAVAETARKTGLEATSEVVIGRPAESILADVQKNRRDAVVIGTRERSSLARNLLGSTALSLLRRCPVPVWVARRGGVHGDKVVLAAIGLGDLAIPVLRNAAAVAHASGAALHVLHVVDLPAASVLRAGAADRETVEWYRKQTRDRAEAEVPRLVTEALGPGAKCSIHLDDGETADTILESARHLDADVVVMGSVVHSGLRALLLGSTAEKVLPALETSMLLVKPTTTSLPAHR